MDIKKEYHLSHSMKSIFTILVMTLLLTSCGQQLGEYYFEDFDQVDHYSIEIDSGELFDTIDEPNLTEDQQLRQDIIINDTPSSLSDTLFINELEKIGFEKNKITGKKIQSIRDIFREKSHSESLGMSCVAVYRDILIFRKNGKIVGIAKVCFSCLQHQIHGTSANTFEFGQSGDYEKLKSILY